MQSILYLKKTIIKQRYHIFLTHFGEKCGYRTEHSWGNNIPLIIFLKNDQHVISIFHIMGKHSYLLDANFDVNCSLKMGATLLNSSLLHLDVGGHRDGKTKIIEAIKVKNEFNLEDYKTLPEKNHVFRKIDNPHSDDSYICDGMTVEYEKYKALVKDIKSIESRNHIETPEVIAVLKSRNTIIDAASALVMPNADRREMYSL